MRFYCLWKNKWHGIWLLTVLWQNIARGSISASIMCALGYGFTCLNLTSLFVKGRWRTVSSTSCHAVHLPPPNRTPQGRVLLLLFTGGETSSGKVTYRRVHCEKEVRPGHESWSFWLQSQQKNYFSSSWRPLLMSLLASEMTGKVKLDWRTGFGKNAIRYADVRDDSFSVKQAHTLKLQVKTQNSWMRNTGLWKWHACRMLLSRIQALQVILRRDNFLPQDEHLQAFGGRYFRGRIKNSGSDALSITRSALPVKA